MRLCCVSRIGWGGAGGESCWGERADVGCALSRLEVLRVRRGRQKGGDDGVAEG